MAIDAGSAAQVMAGLQARAIKIRQADVFMMNARGMASAPSGDMLCPACNRAYTDLYRFVSSCIKLHRGRIWRRRRLTLHP